MNPYLILVKAVLRASGILLLYGGFLPWSKNTVPNISVIINHSKFDLRKWTILFSCFSIFLIKFWLINEWHWYSERKVLLKCHLFCSRFSVPRRPNRLEHRICYCTFPLILVNRCHKHDNQKPFFTIKTCWWLRLLQNDSCFLDALDASLMKKVSAVKQPAFSS